VSAHASGSLVGATSSISRARVWLGGGFIALLACVLWLSAGTAVAAECPNEAIRIAQSATHLPDCRAYERISPADSSGGVAGVDTLNRVMFGVIRADGEAATFGSSGALGERERGGPLTPNLARRTAAGWTSFSVLTTTEPSVPLDLSMLPAWPTPSTDMTRMMFITSRSLGPPNSSASGGSVYLSAPQGQGPPTWLSRWTFEGPQPDPASSQQLPLGGTPDFSSGYFRYSTPLTSQAGDDLRTNLFGLYFFAGSTISPAGVLPSGSVNPSGALPAGTGQASFGGLAEEARNQVSADGSKLFFVSPAEGGAKQLYVQEGGAPGRLISHDMLGNEAASGIAALNGNPSQGAGEGFAYATPDGSRIVFRSESALTGDAPESGVKTYRAEITPGAITLTYLPEVTGYPMAVDKDASTILFRTLGGAPGETSYYVWDEGSPGAPAAAATDLTSSGGPVMLEPVFSEEGDVLVFASGAEVQSGVPPLGENNYTQIYRWTKQSGIAACISCLSGAGTPARFGSQMNHLNGYATDNPANPNGSVFEVFNQSSVLGNRKISSDASRIFFDTSDPLDPARDVNNTRDVYVWENGEVHLLTSGRNPVASMVIDNSTSGNDVMLVTKDGLIPADTNETYDVYTVRVNGGFDEAVEAGCSGDACQPQSAGARPAVTPASLSIRGPGNQRQVQLGSLRVAQLGKPGVMARLRIEVPASGRLKLAGNLVKSKARGVRSKGAVTLSVALNKAGKRKLARNGQLRTKVKVAFRSGDGHSKQRAMTLRFKQGGPR